MKQPLLVRLMPLWICLFLFEGVSYGALFFVQKQYPFAWQQMTIPHRIEKPLSAQVLHPYLGYVNHYGVRVVETMGKEELELPVSSFGFAGTENPVQRRSPDRVIIGILGGSFAKYFSFFGAEAMVQTLKTNAEYQDKEIRIINLAVDGYKEPQQLMVMSYLLSLGAEFDLILNIDGFNEVTLPALDNVPKKTFPFFPRRWASRVQDIPEIVSPLASIFFCENARASLARAFQHPLLRLSATLRLSLFLIHQAFERHEEKLRQNIFTGSLQGLEYAASGPWQEKEAVPEILYPELAQVWKRSSLAIHQLCQSSGIRYFHFLQPNQYTFSSGGASIYRRPVEKGYPLLRQAGKELAETGVSFADLTELFPPEQNVYIDNCCHVSKEANGILGIAIGKRILGKKPA